MKVGKTAELATKQGRLCDINVREYKLEDFQCKLSNFYQLQQIPIVKLLDESQLKYLTVSVEKYQTPGVESSTHHQQPPSAQTKKDELD